MPLQQDEDLNYSDEKTENTETVGDCLSLNETLELVGMTRFHYFLLLTCGLGFASGTIHLLSSNVLVTLIPPQFIPSTPSFGYSKSTLAKIPQMIFLGQLISGLLWSRISDRFGRVRPLILSSFLSTVFALSSALMPSFELFLLMRFLLGLGMGASMSLNFILVFEFFNSELHSKLSPFVILCGIIGVSITALCGLLCFDNFRVFLLLSSFPSVVYFLLLCSMWKLDTPAFLLSKGRVESANRVLASICNNSNYSVIHSQLQSQLPSEPIQRGLWKPYLIRLILFVLMWVSTTFAYHGITVWLSSVGDVNWPVSFQLLFLSLSELPGLALSMVLMQYLPFYVNSFISASGCLLSCILLAYFNNVALVCMLYFFTVGLWANLYIYTPKHFPTQIRSTCLGICNVCSTLAGLFTVQIGGALQDEGLDGSQTLMFFSFFFTVVLACSLLLLFVSICQRAQTPL